METMQGTEDITMNVQTLTVGEPIKYGFGKINGGELSSEAATELSQQVSEHLVAVSPNAPSCCIDGRRCISCMDGQDTEPRPSVAGGALVTAYAAAELIGWFGADESSVTQRLGRINKLLQAAGIKPGTHCDESAVKNKFADNKTGCGADDRFNEIMMQHYDNKDIVTTLTQTILGEEFDDKAMDFASRDKVASIIAPWSPTDVVNAVGASTANNVEVLKSDDSPTHGHAELAVVFNFIDATTVDRDGLVDATGEQVFVVDMWYIDKLAKVLATGPDAESQYKQLKHAMVAYQAATYITLCDGSQRPIILQ
jgi:hypothetical protein